MSDKDYLAAFKAKKGDKLDYGIKGMKWGIRRSKSQLAKGKSGEADAPAQKKSAGNEKQSSGKSGGSSSSSADRPNSIQNNVESSSARYARLQAEAKAGKASSMTEQDLKFFNARTEALAKINKMNETDPGWLSKTTKKVLQNTAQNQMQSVADAVANKYISGPIIESIKKS